MISKKLKWYKLFENEQHLKESFLGRQSYLHKSIFGKFLLINDENNYYAFENKCPHQNKPLDGCKVIDKHIVCPFHQYAFSLKDGKGHGMNVDKFPLRMDEKGVYVGIEKWSFF